MAVYNRNTTILQNISLDKKSLEDIKQSQVIGNDNLVIKAYDFFLGNQAINANATAIFKITFTFDEESNSYILPRYKIMFISSSSAYNNIFYSDPSTVNNKTKKSWFYSFTPTNSTNISIYGNLLCSDNGSASIVRTT